MYICCPKCKEKLFEVKNSMICQNSHCFDIAKEGYLNLLLGNKSGDKKGDNRDMAQNRNAFLSGGYFDLLLNELKDELSEIENCETIVDICCGEGYYSAALSEMFSVYGFDISKEMIKKAAKRHTSAEFFVASMFSTPFPDSGFDAGIHLFAPFAEEEFSRIIKKDGYLITVVPAARHLYSLKEVLYDEPYENDEKLTDLNIFKVVSTKTLTDTITLDTSEKIMSLLKMTPYFYHTPTAGLNRLSALEKLTTEVSFKVVLLKNEKNGDINDL